MIRLRTCILIFALLAVVGGTASAQNARPDLAPIAKDDFGFVHLRINDVWNGEVGAKLRQQFPEPANFLRRDLERAAGIDAEGVDTVTFVLPTAASLRLFGRTEEKKAAIPAKEFKEFKDDKPFDERPKEKKCGEDIDQDEFKKGPGFKEDKFKEAFPFETDDRPREPMILVILTTLKPYDRDKAVRALFRNDEPMEMKHNGKTYLQAKRAFSPALHLLNDRTMLIATSPAFMKRVLGRP